MCTSRLTGCLVFGAIKKCFQKSRIMRRLKSGFIFYSIPQILSLWIYLMTKRQLLDWRIIDKRQVRIYLITHSLAVAAVFYPPQTGWGWLFVLHFLTICLGISIGYHRLLAHLSFKTAKWIRYTFATLGSMALQGGPVSWSAAHRSHHSHTDQRGDPHSAAKGFFWSHMWWAVHKGPNGFRYKLKQVAPDLYKDRYLLFLEKNHVEITIGLFLLTAAVFGISIALWCFPLRIVIGWHCTFFVNSLAHNQERAAMNLPSYKNVFWITLLTYGEGWHKNHHLAPRSPNFQRRWYQIDLGFYCIWLLSKLGLASYRKPIKLKTATQLS